MRLNLATVAAICLAVITAAAAYAAGRTGAPEVIRAQRFEVVNAQGGVRAVLAASAEGDFSLELCDEDGRPRAVLKVLPDGTWLNVEQEKVHLAAADIEVLGVALDLYCADNGEYPTTEQGLDALVRPPSSEPAPANWNGPYVRNLSSDPWGHDYVYRWPGTLHPDSYDILSYGADGNPGGDGYDADICGPVYDDDVIDLAPE